MKEAIIQYNDDPDADGNHMVITWKELVRCKECKNINAPTNGVPFCKHIKKFVDADWFCADGEKVGEVNDR